ncbi:hypothetical protein NDU88_006643 [Pleurodeles waltl]|uniref:Uncharacterized protein n=1 Tax=Pleurodeles waltl TaxID=8319 RepID=A0AAV7RPE2_PLEWA|nr:hypothetical protein NDU88_006643 [Pleurodeles waltl]
MKSSAVWYRGFIAGPERGHIESWKKEKCDLCEPGNVKIAAPILLGPSSENAGPEWVQEITSIVAPLI